MLSANFKPKITAVSSRGFLATARLSCYAFGLFISCCLPLKFVSALGKCAGKIGRGSCNSPGISNHYIRTSKEDSVLLCQVVYEKRIHKKNRSCSNFLKPKLRSTQKMAIEQKCACFFTVICHQSSISEFYHIIPVR